MEQKATIDDVIRLIKETRSEFKSELSATRLELLQHVEALHEDLLEFKKETRTSILDLQEGTFSKGEKEEVLAMVRHYDNWLEEDTLGKRRITLERGEYDRAAVASGFANRFQPA